MPLYSFKCNKCGDFDKILSINGNLRTSECPVCGIDAKRLYTPVAHRWTGFQSPVYELETSNRRLKNNIKIYGREKAEAMELKNKIRRNQKVRDPFE